MPGEASIMRRIEQRARREHWPKPNGWALAYQGSAMALGNAYLLWLAWRDRLSPASLAIFCVAELLLLMAIARIECIPVPQTARFDGRDRALLGAGQGGGFFGRLFVCVFMAIWLGAVYAFGVIADPNLPLFVSGAQPLELLTRLNVFWPLLLGATIALLAMLGNWQLWHRRGGVFVPELSQPLAPKQLTILLAPIPATMALFTWIDDDGQTALFAWCATFLGIKCLLESGMLGLSLFGWYILASLPAPTERIATAVDVRR